MKFGIVFGNIDGKGTQEYLTLIRLLVEAAGYQVTYEKNYTAPGVVNVLLDMFNSDAAAALREGKNQGGELIVVGTEFITGSTFNQFGSREVTDHYVDPEYWQKRFKNFVECARCARAVWLTTNNPEVMDSYRRVLGDIPIVSIPPCFFPDEVVLRERVKDKDLFFSGTFTKYRKELFDSLSQKCSLLAHEPGLPDYIRRHMSMRAKACLNLKINDQWRYPSQLRTWYHLMNGSLVVQEACPESMELDSCTVKIPTEHLLEGCLHLTRSDEWKVHEKALFERFADEWHVQKHVKEFFDRTFQ